MISSCSSSLTTQQVNIYARQRALRIAKMSFNKGEAWEQQEPLLYVRLISSCSSLITQQVNIYACRRGLRIAKMSFNRGELGAAAASSPCKTGG